MAFGPLFPNSKLIDKLQKVVLCDQNFQLHLTVYRMGSKLIQHGLLLRTSFAARTSLSFGDYIIQITCILQRIYRLLSILSHIFTAVDRPGLIS